MRSRPARGRPTWWAILAVSLALMALVAATAARSNNALTPPRLATDEHTTSTTARSQPKANVTVTTLPTLVGASVPTTTPRVGSAAGSSPPSHLAGTTSTTAPASPTSTTTTTQASSGEAVYPGYLQPPSDTSTTYRFNGEGTTEVSVTWSSSTYLSLNVTCSGFNQTTGGSSVISMSIPDAQGTCQAVLSEPAPANAVVSYTLTVNPSSGT
jgi:hypothetical protein